MYPGEFNWPIEAAHCFAASGCHSTIADPILLQSSIILRLTDQMSQCFCVKNENKRRRHREDRHGQELALRNCLYPMRYVVDCTELVGVREQTRSPSFLVLRKLRAAHRDGGQPAYVHLLATAPES